jgi:hypothetical protein
MIVMKKVSLLDYVFAVTIVIIIFGIIYDTVQQNYRGGAMDP